jgi:hypothetical protein
VEVTGLDPWDGCERVDDDKRSLSVISRQMGNIRLDETISHRSKIHRSVARAGSSYFQLFLQSTLC